MKHGLDGEIQSKSFKYNGNWVYNKMQGEGNYEDEIGRYEGMFEAGYKEGSGTLYYNDGKIFRGVFSVNTAIQGELILTDGTRLGGEWRSDS